MYREAINCRLYIAVFNSILTNSGAHRFRNTHIYSSQEINTKIKYPISVDMVESTMISVIIIKHSCIPAGLTMRSVSILALPTSFCARQLYLVASSGNTSEIVSTASVGEICI